MTATLYPRQRVDRVTARPVGRASIGSPTGLGDTVDAGVNYTARRAAATLIVVFLVASVAIAGSALGGALADVGGRPAAASVGGAAADMPGVRIHVAQPGDTLWSIADRHRGEVGQRRFVDALIDVNGGTVIEIGQAVRLP